MRTSRRTFIQNTFYVSAVLAAGGTMSAIRADDERLPTAENLRSTALIEANHPRIMALAKEITRSVDSKKNAAIRIHNWVRDQIPFGIPRGFYETSATETLDAKVGYCNTKVTLFNALLRASAIPTRMRMMDLSAQVLQGLLDPGTSYVDHALTEVFIDGRWIQVDSYVVDKPLVVAATKKLALGNSKAGYGIHLHGNPDWNGRDDNFIQYMNNDAIPNYVLQDHGLFADVADYYQKAHKTRNRKTLISGLAIRLGYASINARIQEVRAEGSKR
jgi:transglutaminase-like putative cysteine protease